MRNRLSHAFALPIAAALMLGSPQSARSSAVWGATEWTQVANNLELVMQYKEMVEQTITQVRQYEAQLKSLRQMDGAKLQGMLKGVGGMEAGEEVLRALSESEAVHERLRSLAGNMEVLVREGHNAVEVAKTLRERGYEVNPDDYISMMRMLAEVEQETYGERLEALDRAAADAQHDIQRVRNIAAMSEQIETHVEGFGALLQSSAVVSSQLSGLRQTMSVAAIANTEAAAFLADEAAERKVSEMRRQQWINNSMMPIGGDQ